LSIYESEEAENSFNRFIEENNIDFENRPNDQKDDNRHLQVKSPQQKAFSSLT
jgi:hypothetical protein